MGKSKSATVPSGRMGFPKSPSPPGTASTAGLSRFSVSGKAGSSYSGATRVIRWWVGGVVKKIQAACGSYEGRAFLQLSGVSCATWWLVVGASVK